MDLGFLIKMNPNPSNFKVLVMGNWLWVIGTARVKRHNNLYDFLIDYRLPITHYQPPPAFNN